jgi:hypothetical protein
MLEAIPVGTHKRPYAAPRLIVHGTVAMLTHRVGPYFKADGGSGVGQTRSSTVACQNGNGNC